MVVKYYDQLYNNTSAERENCQTACHFRRKKFAQIWNKLKQNKNLPRFGHVFDFDHFTKGALTQGGLHSIWKMTKTTKTCQVNYEKNSQLKQTIPLLKKSFWISAIVLSTFDLCQFYNDLHLSFEMKL